MQKFCVARFSHKLLVARAKRVQKSEYEKFIAKAFGGIKWLFTQIQFYEFMKMVRYQIP